MFQSGKICIVKPTKSIGKVENMRENYLFRTYSSKDYVKIAEEAAKWIEGNEVDTENGKYWIQSPDSTEDFSDYPMLTPKSLYGGGAGIGLFFLRLYQATGKITYLENAKAAAGHIIATDEGEDFYNRILNNENKEEDKLIHVKNMPGWKIGYYNGPAGGAYLALKLFEITAEEKYKTYVLKVADDLLSVAKSSKKEFTGVNKMICVEMVDLSRCWFQHGS